MKLSLIILLNIKIFKEKYEYESLEKEIAHLEKEESLF